MFKPAPPRLYSDVIRGASLRMPPESSDQPPGNGGRGSSSAVAGSENCHKRIAFPLFPLLTSPSLGQTPSRCGPPCRRSGRCAVDRPMHAAGSEGHLRCRLDNRHRRASRKGPLAPAIAAHLGEGARHSGDHRPLRPSTISPRPTRRSWPRPPAPAADPPRRSCHPPAHRSLDHYHLPQGHSILPLVVS